jgi:hypothetical protein
MRKQTPNAFILAVILILLTVSAPAQAAGKPQLLLSAKRDHLKVGQETTVEVLVKNAPSIYGADIQVDFDPQVLEVIDVDNKQAGVQIEPGNFIEAKKSFILTHQVGNETGTINYALTLLNPAPAVQGDGKLALITFRAKAEGQTTLSIKKGMFGTKTGETVAPELVNTQIFVDSKKENSDPPAAGETSDSGQPGTTTVVIALAGTGVGCAGLLGIWYWLRYIRR